MHQETDDSRPLTNHKKKVNQLRTFNGVGPIVKFQLEDIVGRSVGVQGRRSCFTRADEAVLPAQDDDWTVDQFHQELFGLS